MECRVARYVKTLDQKVHCIKHWNLTFEELRGETLQWKCWKQHKNWPSGARERAEEWSPETSPTHPASKSSATELARCHRLRRWSPGAHLEAGTRRPPGRCSEHRGPATCNGQPETGTARRFVFHMCFTCVSHVFHMSAVSAVSARYILQWCDMWKESTAAQFWYHGRQKQCLKTCIDVSRPKQQASVAERNEAVCTDWPHRHKATPQIFSKLLSLHLGSGEHQLEDMWYREVIFLVLVAQCFIQFDTKE